MTAKSMLVRPKARAPTCSPPPCYATAVRFKLSRLRCHYHIRLFLHMQNKAEGENFLQRACQHSPQDLKDLKKVSQILISFSVPNVRVSKYW